MSKEKAFLTHKSGKFTFSAHMDGEVITPKLWKAKSLFHSFADLPILPGLASRIDEEVIIKSLHGTAAIEGNPLSEEDVRSILAGTDGGEPLEEAKKRSRQEILNLKAGYAVLAADNREDIGSLFNETILQQLNKVITIGIPYELHFPGEYRNHIVKVGHTNFGGVYTPPKCLQDVKDLMVAFIEWINSKEILDLDPALRAVLAHYHLAAIHPFGNGNGRTARLLEAVILSRSGIAYAPQMLSNYYYRHMEDYFIAFRAVQKSKTHDMTPFVSFYLDGMIESFKVIKAKIVGGIRYLALKDHYDTLRREKKITARQYDLLRMLLTMEKEIILSVKALQHTPPFESLYRGVTAQTARNDINRLLSMRLLTETGQGLVLNALVLDSIQQRTPGMP